MNTFIYLVKLIASFGVIILHTRFPGGIGFALDAICRYVCPFFFAVSGRFLIPYNMRDTADIRSRTAGSIRKLLKTIGMVYGIYLAFSLIYHFVNGISFKDWFSSKFNPQELIFFLVFNSGKVIYDGSYTFDHLWYLFAVLYVFVLIYIFAPVLRKWNKALIFTLLGLLYFGELLQTFYPIRPFDISINTWFILRNWLLVGMPYVMIGIWFSDYTGELKEKLGDETYREKSAKWLLPSAVSIILGMTCSVLECLLMGKKECPFGALLMVLGILFMSETGIGGGKYLWKIGKDASPDIYYYHVLIIAFIDHLANNEVIPYPPMWLKPFIIIFLCLLFIWYIPGKIKDIRKRVNE